MQSRVLTLIGSRSSGSLVARKPSPERRSSLDSTAGALFLDELTLLSLPLSHDLAIAWQEPASRLAEAEQDRR